MSQRKLFGRQESEFIREHCVATVEVGGNGMYIATAGGKLLSPKDFPDTRIGDLHEAYQEFLKLPESERKPKEIPPASFTRLLPPSGGMAIRTYIRALERDGAGKLVRNELQSRECWGPNRDFLWLTGEEVRAMAPAGKGKGTTYPVPPSAARRLFLYTLNGRTIMLGYAWDGEMLRSGELTLTVEETSDKEIRLRLEGKARIADSADWSQAGTRCDFKILGYLEYDPKKKEFKRFDAVALGDLKDGGVSEYYQQCGAPTSYTLGVGYERVPPEAGDYGTLPWAMFSGFGHAPDDSAVQHYFGTNPYHK